LISGKKSLIGVVCDLSEIFTPRNNTIIKRSTPGDIDRPGSLLHGYLFDLIIIDLLNNNKVSLVKDTKI
jgi:hypothetical protein